MDRYTKLTTSFYNHMVVNKEKECCGIITKSFDYVPCKNISANPKNSFVLDPIALLKYEEDCWGIFHSHTSFHDELPSEVDKQSAVFSQYKFIVGNLNKTFYLYWIDNLGYLRFKDFSEEDMKC